MLWLANLVGRSLLHNKVSMCPDWLKHCAVPENKAQVDDSKLAFKILLQNFVKLDPNKTFSVTQTNAVDTSYLSTVNT